MKITADLLRSKGACNEQVALFAKLYPKGARVTVAACIKVADKFNWHWAANNLLSAPARAQYNKALATAFAKAWLADQH